MIAPPRIQETTLRTPLPANREPHSSTTEIQVHGHTQRRLPLMTADGNRLRGPGPTLNSRSKSGRNLSTRLAIKVEASREKG